MATQTLSAADAILKDLYVGPVVEQLNYKTYLLDQIERDSDHVDALGRRFIVPVHTGRNRGRGARGDGGTLPTAGTQSWADAIINVTYQYAAIEVTDGAVKASQGNAGAFVNILDAETKGATNDLRKDINRQVFGTGDGLLGSVTVTATTPGTSTGMRNSRTSAPQPPPRRLPESPRSRCWQTTLDSPDRVRSKCSSPPAGSGVVWPTPTRARSGSMTLRP
jgi:hypothetical protein